MVIKTINFDAKEMTSGLAAAAATGDAMIAQHCYWYCAIM